jgi:hypothetical protein
MVQDEKWPETDQLLASIPKDSFDVEGISVKILLNK